jgi:small subunit ribosomal protein S16
MVVIRMARGGSKKRPFFHVVVADQRFKRDGRYIERLGFQNPVARGGELPVSIDMEKYNAWIAKGAQPSERVAALVKELTKA